MDAPDQRKQDVLLSMSPTDLKELQGDYLVFEKAENPGLAAEAAQVRVVDLDGNECCLPKKRCQTWFEL
ncbi:Mg2+ transporter protein CorA-like/Zinc transport protein ZntB [Penicillium malachiteum]|uniref:Mg2+ transporter protein CorA-like/Zinc transport protein ZntB n=1 Tax=Penicillium malachiteum TaxID=1324776 RepID=UPI0025494DFF|nr:Mg2+ transporter protein CorA-like/Zinc transport protein ZntB [Penicillium malachiteum]KAJ5731362.1 Mg2+ transporter protein CorA-like/Zinc transport protein ZntB [Penicillium malachiteum]